MSEVFESDKVPKKTRKPRAPMSDEKKKAFAERMKIAREKKKALKEKTEKSIDIDISEPAQTKVEASKPLETIKEVSEAIVPNVNSELLELKAQLAEMKIAKAKEIDEKKAKKKATALKRKETMAKKALEQKLKSNVVATPAPPLERPVKKTITAPMAPKQKDEYDDFMDVLEKPTKTKEIHFSKRKSKWAKYY